MNLFILTLLLTLSVAIAHDFEYDDPQMMRPSHKLAVQLMEWSWKAVANECEWLSKHGYGMVQVSPPMEHVFFNYSRRGKTYPWFFRYQITSYKLNSRSGDAQEFVEMVKMCASHRVGWVF